MRCATSSDCQYSSGTKLVWTRKQLSVRSPTVSASSAAGPPAPPAKGRLSVGGPSEGCCRLPAPPPPPRLPAPRCPGWLYSTDRRLRSRTASGLRARTRASSPPAASIRGGGRRAAAHAPPQGGGDTAGTSFRPL